MSDFNPNSRKREDFFYPEQTWFTQTKNYLVSALTAPVTIRGIDISHWNGEVDFEAVKNSGIDFVIIKATEGIDFLDPKFEYNWNGALDNDLITMPFHFFRSNYKGNPQLQWFLQNADKYLEAVNSKTILWWDVETEDGVDVITRQNRLLGACTNTLGYGLQTGYYSSPWKWQSLIGNVTWAKDFFQWVAHWADVTYPTLPVGWTKEMTKVWQNGIYPTYPWVEPVEGAGKVDHDYFFGTLQDLVNLLGYIPPVDCCNQVKEELEIIKTELVIIKSRLAQSELDNIRQDEDMKRLKINGAVFDERISEIENLINKVNDVFCK